MVYPDKFLRALAFTLEYEGGYVNHPYDKGGPTNQGITQQTYDDYCKSHKIPNKPVKTITEDEVMDIYYNMYWLPAGCSIYPIKIAIAVFDFAVNSGVSRAVRYLKQSGGMLEPYLQSREQYFKTIAKCNNCVFLHGWLNRLNALRTYLKNVK